VAGIKIEFIQSIFQINLIDPIQEFLKSAGQKGGPTRNYVKN